MSGRPRVSFRVTVDCPWPALDSGGGRPPYRAIQLAHQIADADGKYKLAVDGVENLFTVTGNNKKFLAVSEVFE
jgi:hypothetical protein